MDSSLSHLMSWSEVTKGEVPPPLTGPSITILPAPGPPTVFLFGGKYVHNRRLTNEMWAMDLVTKVWSRVDAGPGPAPRYFHSMDVWEDKLVCFGGMSDTDPTSVHNDLWFFDCVSRKWVPPTSSTVGLGLGEEQDPSLLPAPRYAHLSAVSRGQLVISGGQHSDNSWVYEINVYDLRQKRWISKTPQPEAQGQHSKGAYRSVMASSKQRVITAKSSDGLAASPAASSQSYSIDEEGEGGQIWCYSNYDFAKVRRELDVFTPSNEVMEPVSGQQKHTSTPTISISDRSSRMRGTSQPPGLRFPTGGIVGNHFILCGLYLASTSAAFSIWSLDLGTMLWRHIEPAVLGSGSWNRAVIWPEKAIILIFGNSGYDLAGDYSRRAVNLDHVAVVSLETYGIYRPPKLGIPSRSQELHLTALNENLASDFDVICDDGRRIKCNRQILSERWEWFRKQEGLIADKLNGAVRDAPAVDIADTLLGSFTPARLVADSLTIPEPFPVCVALVQYFYTLSLATPLQNRAPVLSALLFLAKQYKIDRLAKLVVHALHERLEPSIAVGIYEIATLAGEQDLQSAESRSASRINRHGPAGSIPSENAQLTDSGSGPDALPSSAKQSDSGASNGRSIGGLGGEVNHRAARVESMTLVDGSEEVDSLLAALALAARETVTMPFPADPTRPPLSETSPAPARHDHRQPSILNTASTTSRDFCLGVPLNLRTPELVDDRENHRPSSPTNSDATSAYPATPAESVRDSSIFPPRDGGVDSQPSSSSSHFGSIGLPPLPEDLGSFDRFRTINGSMWSASGHHGNSDKVVRPSTLENAGLISRAPPQALSSYQAQAISNQRSYSSLDSFVRYRTHAKHLSTATASSSSSVSSVRDVKSQVPSTHDTIDYQTSLDEQSKLTMSSPARSNSFFTRDRCGAPVHSSAKSYNSRTTAETASILTTSSGDSSKKQLKAEKKAIAAAAKAAKKAEAQAKFEALRSEQIQKMAIAKAEVQRREEKAKFEAPVVRVEPKSKLGRFGAKFADSVLFPAGGSNSTMF